MNFLRKIINIGLCALLLMPIVLMAQPTHFSRDKAEKTTRHLLKSIVCMKIMQQENAAKKYAPFFRNNNKKNVLIFGEVNEKIDNCGTLVFLIENSTKKDKAIRSTFSALTFLETPATAVVAGSNVLTEINSAPYKKAVSIIRGMLKEVGEDNVKYYPGNQAFNGSAKGRVSAANLAVDRYAANAMGQSIPSGPSSLSTSTSALQADRQFSSQTGRASGMGARPIGQTQQTQQPNSPLSTPSAARQNNAMPKPKEQPKSTAGQTVVDNTFKGPKDTSKALAEKNTAILNQYANEKHLFTPNQQVKAGLSEGFPSLCGHNRGYCVPNQGIVHLPPNPAKLGSCAASPRACQLMDRGWRRHVMSQVSPALYPDQKAERNLQGMAGEKGISQGEANTQAVCDLYGICN